MNKTNKKSTSTKTVNKQSIKKNTNCKTFKKGSDLGK